MTEWYIYCHKSIISVQGIVYQEVREGIQTIMATFIINKSVFGLMALMLFAPSLLAMMATKLQATINAYEVPTNTV